MSSAFLKLVESRVSTDRFDPSFGLTDAEISDLVRIAVKAPSAYNLQNWRFIAVRSAVEKLRLRQAAFDQAKIEDASAVIILCGLMPEADTLRERLAPSVSIGFMSEGMATAWQAAAALQYADPQAARDEAIRSATLVAAFLMLAAEAKGFASCPMVGFDALRVMQAFDLSKNEVPVMLLAIGRAAHGNWPQKSRRPIEAILSLR